MAIWKVSAERAEIFPHPNSDRMDLCKVGMFQLVEAKTKGYQTGDVIVFAPSRAVLPLDLRHIREGIVVTPVLPRPSREGWNLALKIISGKFKGSDEDPS